MKKIIIFNVEIKQGYIEAEGYKADVRNEILQDYALIAIKKRIKWFSELTNKELLKYCKIEEEK